MNTKKVELSGERARPTTLQDLSSICPSAQIFLAGLPRSVRITPNGKEVDINSLRVDGVDMADYPDFCDAYISSGQFMDGSEMSEDEIEILSEDSVLLSDIVHETYYERY